MAGIVNVSEAASIAFHTAFAVFGASRLLDYSLNGPLAFLPWVLPAAIGLPAIHFWTRHYRRKIRRLSCHTGACRARLKRSAARIGDRPPFPILLTPI